ncbi:serine hydrolase [Pedobacter sp. HMF7647]|uniref:Serine hydrolase n=1 Tax=Hufsiella arboris TaxID=2695275 RepID=A0A7K1YBG4_9SPHI|nr:serine hydrolase domain-containing protein [Hufsiella arboris]MXV51937.1 serine hydrolase [Hufsiella arboris]
MKISTSILKRSISSLIFFFTINVFGQVSQNHPNPSESRTVLLHKLKEVMKEEHIPGLMISIVKGDSIYAGGLGYADVKNKIPVSSRTLFLQNSVTKMFTAMGILQLVHQGKFKLTDELKKIAPEIEFQNKWEDTNPVKVVHLLEHTAGFDDVHLNNMYSNKSEKHKGLEAAMIFKNSYVSRWKPGQRMSYSNPDYAILGYLIEKFSGKSWSSFIKESVLSPIGMHDSNCELKVQDLTNYAIGYRFSNGDPIPFPFNSPAGTGSGSALKADAQDMAKFVRFFLNDWRTDSSRWLPLSYLEQMETVHSTLAAKNGLKLGYGFANEKFPNNSKVTFRGHFGGDNGFNSLVLYNREHKLGYAICNNGYKGMWRLSQLIEEYLTLDLPLPKVDQPISLGRSADAYLGYYQFLNTQRSKWNFLQKITNGFKVEKSADKLIVHWMFGRQDDTLYRMKNMLFKRKHDLDPYYVFGKDDEGTPFFQGERNEYYQKTAYFPVLMQQVFLGLTTLAVLLSILLAVITLIPASFKNSKPAVRGPVFFPILAFISGFLAYRTLSVTDETNKLLYNDFNISSGTIFFGSLGFAVYIFYAIFLLYRKWNSLRSWGIKGMLCFNLGVLGCFAFYLAVHGWIGICVWNL